MQSLRRSFGVAIAVAVLASSCSGTSDYEADEVEVVDSLAAPGWVLDGLRIARATLEQGEVELVDTGTQGSSPSTNSPIALPRGEILDGLLSMGLTEEQAECIYTGISVDESIASDIGALLGFGAIDGAELLLGPSAGENASPASAEPELDQQSATAILLTIAPCVDIEVLMGLVASLGAVPGLNADGSVDLSTLDIEDLDLPEGVDLSMLAALASGSGGGINEADYTAALANVVTPEQITAFQNALTAAIPQTLNPALLAGLDISNLDLTTISDDQMGLLLAAVVSGLTPDQQGQLQAVASADFASLGLQIDPEKLSSGDLGALLLLISPILTASISPTKGAPPPGVDPSEIYIPEGVTLANINPLAFVPREDVVAAFKLDGVNEVFSGCLYDRLRNLSTDALAAIFQNSGTDVAGAELILISIQCLIAPF